MFGAGVIVRLRVGWEFAYEWNVYVCSAHLHIGVGVLLQRKLFDGTILWGEISRVMCYVCCWYNFWPLSFSWCGESVCLCALGHDTLCSLVHCFVYEMDRKKNQRKANALERGRKIQFQHREHANLSNAIGSLNGKRHTAMQHTSIHIYVDGMDQRIKSWT